MSIYTKLIVELTKCKETEAPLVEGYLRLIYGTLDGLDRARFKREAKAALKDVRNDPEEARLTAESYGLIRKEPNYCPKCPAARAAGIGCECGAPTRWQGLGKDGPR